MTDVIIPIKNVNLEELGLINQGLFPVEGELAKRYNQILKEVFGWENELESFRVDKRGLSPEVAKHLKQKYPNHERLEYAENYLNIKSANQFMIVVSPEQKDAPLIAPQNSYEDGVYYETYRQARHTIEDITSSEALFGELEDGVHYFSSVADLLQLRTIELSLDTPHETVKHFFELKKMLDKLTPEQAIDEEYMSRIKESAKVSGRIAERAISKVFPITKEIHCFYTEFFQGAHCLRNFKNKDSINTLFITHHQAPLRLYDESILNLDIHSKELLEALHKYKFLQYNSDLIDRRMEEIEDDMLLQRGVDLADITSPKRKIEIINHAFYLPKQWHELKHMNSINESGNNGLINKLIKDASYETRLKLSQAAAKPEIINHILAELDPSDVIQLYEFNRTKLTNEFAKMPVNRQRYIAYKLLTQLNSQGGKK
jgi:hypothetical protein